MFQLEHHHLHSSSDLCSPTLIKSLSFPSDERIYAPSSTHLLISLRSVGRKLALDLARMSAPFLQGKRLANTKSPLRLRQQLKPESHLHRPVAYAFNEENLYSTRPRNPRDSTSSSEFSLSIALTPPPLPSLAAFAASGTNGSCAVSTTQWCPAELYAEEADARAMQRQLASPIPDSMLLGAKGEQTSGAAGGRQVRRSVSFEEPGSDRRKSRQSMHWGKGGGILVSPSTRVHETAARAVDDIIVKSSVTALTDASLPDNSPVPGANAEESTITPRAGPKATRLRRRRSQSVMKIMRQDAVHSQMLLCDLSGEIPVPAIESSFPSQSQSNDRVTPQIQGQASRVERSESFGLETVASGVKQSSRKFRDQGRIGNL